MATRIKKTDLARDALYNKVNTMIDEVNTKIDNKDSLPSQTGNAGKFLTTDGTNASWGKVKQIKIKQDLTNPSADTVPSTKAVKDESSRITTLMNTKITNCITEIPQDIKLELNNGTLTVKAGSKVYVPNGFEADGTTPKFDVKIIESDITADPPYADEPFFIYYVDNAVVPVPSSLSVSGTSNTIIDDLSCWYDTTNNIIKLTFGSEVGYSGMSLPLTIINVTSNGDWTSIDQVFNGFGYIGSTVFALPGVKGLIPNGRNADGSLKSIEFTISQVQTFSITSNWGTGVEGWWLNGTNMYIHRGMLATYFQDSKPSTSYEAAYWFSPKENILRETTDTGATWTQIQGSYSFSISFTNGKITSFTPKTVFHALDYNDAVKYSDRETVVGWSIPDYNSGITLTFNKVFTNAGESKTMAKSGLFCFEFLVNNVISTIYFYVNNHFVGKIGNSKTSVAFWDEINFPVTKGDVVKVTAETVGGFTAAAVESYLFPYKGSMYE